MLRRTRRPLACVPILCTLAAIPTAALARTAHGGSGGIGTGGTGTTGGTPSTYSAAPFSPGAVAPDVITLGGTLNASGHGITVSVAAAGTQGQPLAITGNAPAGDAGRLIDIQAVRVGRTNWAQVATATIAAGGSFSAQWTPAANGQMTLRAVLAPAITGDATTAPSSTASTGASGLTGSSSGSAAAATSQLRTSVLTIPIFRNATATIYGPGLWGRRTACGERLTHATLGVASRTLKCGTKVAVLYQGRELTVPVIDRGPFTKGVSWDLTMATATALGISETATVGTLSSKVAPSFNGTS